MLRRPCSNRQSGLPFLLFLMMGVAPALGQVLDSAPAGAAEDLLLERVDVQRVVVDLVATRKGEPVVDLQRDELRVFEDGELVEVLEFVAPVLGSTEQATSLARPVPSAANSSGEGVASVAAPLVLFVDELHLEPHNKLKVLKQARKAADELIDAGGKVTVLAFDGQLRMVLAPTSDKQALRRALEEEIASKRMPMMASMADPSRVIPVIHQRMLDETQERGGGGPGGRPSGNDPCIDVGGIALSSAQQAASVVEQSLAGLRLLIGSLGRFAGRKTLLYVNDGVPLVPGMEVMTYAIEMCDGTAARQGVPRAVDVREFTGVQARWDPYKARTEMMDFDTTAQWRELAAYANAQQVSIYPIQATGLENFENSSVSDVRTTMTFTQTALGNPRDTLALLARQTGGEAFFDTNQFDRAMLEAAALGRVTYQLTFEPRAAVGSGTHAIRVEVSRPGVQLRHRKSFTTRGPASELVDLAMSGLTFGSGANPLGVRLVLAPPGETPAAEGRQRSVNVTVEVPLDRLALVPVGAERRGRFTVALGGRQSNGRYLPIGFRRIDVRASEVDQQSQAFEYEIEVPFRGDGVDLSVAVRDDLGGVHSLALASLSPQP